jgi:hypothetical protein
MAVYLLIDEEISKSYGEKNINNKIIECTANM